MLGLERFSAERPTLLFMINKRVRFIKWFSAQHSVNQTVITGVVRFYLQIRQDSNQRPFGHPSVLRQSCSPIVSSISRGFI